MLLYIFAINVVLIIIITFWYWSNRDYREKLAKIKCEPTLPLFGHVFRFGANPKKMLYVLEEMWNNAGRDKFLVKIGPIEHVVLTRPEDVEVILSSNVLIEKTLFYELAKQWLGDGIATCPVNKWRVHRKLLTPAFNYKILESYMPSFVEEGKAMVKDLLNHESEIETMSLIGNYALRTVSGTALGLNFDVKSDAIEDYLHNNLIIKNLINSRVFSIWKFFEILYQMTSEGKEFKKSLKIVTDLNLEVLKKKREDMKELIESVKSGEMSLESFTEDRDFLSKRKLTFIEILLLSKKPDGTSFSDKEIEHEVRTFMTAGQETVAVALSFTLYCLAQNPEVQTKLYEEQLFITGRDLQQPITYQKIQEMKYLERVIKEALRLYPPAVFFGRKMSRNTFLPDGTELPVGCCILVVPYLSQRNPDIYEDPESFDPDRFLNNKIHPYAYLPFSAGPRNCIGQKLAMLVLKCWVAVLVRSIEFLPGETPVQMYGAIVMNSLTGVHVRTRPRSH